MVDTSFMIFGPSGVGKSPLDKLVRKEVICIEPYRLRPEGPRDEHDVLYAPPYLREQLHLTFHRLGLAPSFPAPGIEWFPQAMTLFLKVRTDWQVLFLAGAEGRLAKAEIYAPSLIPLLDIPGIRHLFGELKMVILNPATIAIGPKAQSPREEGALLQELIECTEQNCTMRGDHPEQAKKRAESVREELPAWRHLIQLGAREYVDWPFPEYKYRRKYHRRDDPDPAVLAQARSALVQKWRDLAVFLCEEG